MKVQISLNDKLMERADKYADLNYLSRSGLISLALTNYLKTNAEFRKDGIQYENFKYRNHNKDNHRKIC